MEQTPHEQKIAWFYNFLGPIHKHLDKRIAADFLTQSLAVIVFPSENLRYQRSSICLLLENTAMIFPLNELTEQKYSKKQFNANTDILCKVFGKWVHYINDFGDG